MLAVRGGVGVVFPVSVHLPPSRNSQSSDLVILGQPRQSARDAVVVAAALVDRVAQQVGALPSDSHPLIDSLTQ